MRAFAALRARAISIELLVTIAAVGAIFIGEYWESAAVTFLFVLGGYLEARTLARTRSALKDMLAPTEVTVFRDGSEINVAPHEVIPGETVVVRPGGRIGVDGAILSGRSAIDESAITGEPIPAEKQVGDKVFAGTVSHNGYLEIHAEGVGADTTLARIIQRVEEAQEAKAPTQRMIERFASWYTPMIIVLAIGAYVISKDVALALTLLVIGCPGALVISTPISVIAGIGRAARDGILIKGGEYLETAGRIKAVAFDKTGTLTEGRPEVMTITPLSGIPALPTITDEGSPRTRLLQWAALAESGSEHPLGRAVERALPESYVGPRAESFDTAPGGGISAGWQDRKVEIGRPDWIETRVEEWPAAAITALEDLHSRGETAAAVAVDGVVIGLLGFADRVRPDAIAALQALRKTGVKRLVMLTGDHAASAWRVARELGIDEVHAGLLPEQKLEAIKTIQRESGPTAMVGDGINDAPALAAADIGIAMGAAGTDVAIESADIALMADDLGKIPEAIGLARATLNNIRQNVVIALLTVTGLLAGVFAQQHSPWHLLHMKILLVEDDKLLGDGIAAGIAQSGLVVDWVLDGQQADAALATGSYDAVVLDLGLPRLSGMELLRRVRARGQILPILILTARDAVEDRVAGLDAGADDYLVKPFDLAELQARLRALLRRSKGYAEPIISLGELRVDPASHSVSLSGGAVDLSAREFAILHTLLLNAGRVMSKAQIEEQLYGWGEEVESNAIEVFVHHLRRKLGRQLIRTIRGVGYMIEKPGP